MTEANDQKQTSIMKSCARNVALIAVGIVSIGITIGWVSDHRVELAAWLSEVNASALYIVSIGGQFWGAVSVGGLALVVAAWASCVGYRSRQIAAYGYPRCDAIRTRWLIALCIVCISIWALACAGMHATFAVEPLDQLSSYKQIASTIMDLPIWIGGICSFFGLVLALYYTSTTQSQ